MRKIWQYGVMSVLVLQSFLGEGHGSGGGFPPQQWSFQGINGTFDRGALQRGFQVYKEVCAACHGLSRVRYRDLTALGYTPGQVKTLAAEARVIGAQQDAAGMPLERPGLPSDGLPSPYPTEQAARDANQGALPPDLSLIIKARQGGPDYVYALLTGYGTAPSGMVVQPGLYYNHAFPGHQIGMAPPLADGQISYGDGTPSDTMHMAHDVVTFLSWAAEPEMEQRKRMGIRTIMYLSVLTLLLFFWMRRVWTRLSPQYKA